MCVCVCVSETFISFHYRCIALFVCVCPLCRNSHLFTDSLSCTFCPPQWLRCKGNIDFSTVKTPRHYFLHLTNCNGPRETTGIWNLEYKVHMTNGQGPFVHKFSFDQRCKSITYVTNNHLKTNNCSREKS